MEEILVNEKIARITADLDDRDINNLIHCLKTFRRYGYTKDVTVRLSSSGRGYHCIGWNEKKGHSLDKLLKIRKKIDDPTRVRLDGRLLTCRSRRAVQVLFYKKTKKEIKW
jgi:hypothetical protein